MAAPGYPPGGCSVINQTGCGAGYVCVGEDLFMPGTCVPENIPKFMGGMAITALPDCMREAVEASKTNTQTPAHDAIMGRIGDPINDKQAVCNGKSIVPYCQQPAFYNTTYCACRNANLPYAECIAVDCTANYATTAYLDTTQRSVRTGDRSVACPQQQVCNSITTIGGSGNIAQISQVSNCGDAAPGSAPGAPGAAPAAGASQSGAPAVAVLILIMVVVLAVALMAPKRKKLKAAPATPLDPAFSALDGPPDALAASAMYGPY